MAVVLPFVMTASFAIVIVIARYRRDVSMMPATCASQALVVLVAAPFASLGSATDSRLAAVLRARDRSRSGVGLALLTIGARLLPPAEVALMSLLEVVLGPLWVWLAYSERPSNGDARRRRRRDGRSARAGDGERGADARTRAGAVPAPDSS